MAESKKNLNDITSPTVFRRSKVRREYTTALRQESAKRAIGEIWPGCEIFVFTKGQWSLVDGLEHLLSMTGPADVFLSTWSAAGADIRAAFNFIQDGRIRTFKMLTDYSFQSRKPGFCKELIATFGADSVRVSVVHTKFALIRNDKWNLVVRTSANLNWNPRFESLEISDSKEFADFMWMIIQEVWDSQEAAEGFRVRPSDNVKAFKKTFQDQTSVFGGLVDGRDLLT